MESASPPLNRLRTLWGMDHCALGAMATVPFGQTVQILAAAGLDFILLDMEHRLIGPAEEQAMIAAIANTPLVPLARVATTTSWRAKLTHDLRAMGACFPLISMRAASAGDAGPACDGGGDRRPHRSKRRERAGGYPLRGAGERRQLSVVKQA